MSLGKFEGAVEATLKNLADQDFAGRLWQKDASLWSEDAAVQAQISNSLGWLMVGDVVAAAVPRLTEFANEIKGEGFEWVVLLGMGGSSLAPEVLRQTFGHTPGYPQLVVVDTTDPNVVLATEKRADPAKTLYIVSSKSGSTTEPNVLMAYYLDKVRQIKGENAGQHFITITDAGSSMEQFAKDNGFRQIFLNPADIGGRYSALSFFGMVPAALAGYNVAKLLENAKAMATLCHASGSGNPGLSLGVTMGTLAKDGVDKVTVVLPAAIASYGLWVEQLIAESTGKSGRGIVPVAGEALGSPESYGSDRLFVAFELAGESDVEAEAKLAVLQNVGHPVVKITLKDRFDIATEFFRWEFAIPTAGAIININPFDQPGVQESKDNTKRLLTEYNQTSQLPVPDPVAQSDFLTVYGETGASSVMQYISDFMAQIKPGDYVSLQAYLTYTEANGKTLEALQSHIRDKYKVATTLGYGPRFLHSTGQLHKGGANNGVFIQITQDNTVDAQIPGDKASFGVLIKAQALGDLQALQSHERRAISLNLKEVSAGLQELNRVLGF